jgi:DNA-binding transcriptional MerR regulator
MDITEQFSPSRRLLTTGEVAVMLGVTRQRVHRLAQLGVLQPVRLVPKGHLRYRIEDVAKLINEGGKP